MAYWLGSFGVAHPVLLAWMATLGEFVGGLLVLVGLLTPLAAAIIASTMVVAIVLVHGKSGFLNSKTGRGRNPFGGSVAWPGHALGPTAIVGNHWTEPYSLWGADFD
jgi:uncharacterized membrane protein YphA (DoxX/SURF4 family)